MTSLSMHEELSWIDRLRSGAGTRDEVLRELRDLLTARLRSALREKAADEDFIADVVQDALVQILASLDQFEGRSKFTSWATTIAIRTAYTELRRKRWKDISLDQLLEDRAGGDSFAVDGDPDARDSAARAGIVRAMYSLIEQKLTEKQRLVLLAELKGMPQEEVGRRLGSNRNAIYKLAHDARKRLKREMEQLGYSHEDLAAFRS